MIKKGIFAVIGIAAFSLVGSTSQDAVAGSHVFAPPIGSCVKATASGSIVYGWEGFLNVSATENLYIDCGVPYTTRDTEQRVVIAQVNDQSTTRKVSCSMKAFTLNGVEVFNGGTKDSADTNAPTGVASLAWIIPDGAGALSTYVSCNIPPEQSTPSGLLGVISAS